MSFGITDCRYRWRVAEPVDVQEFLAKDGDVTWRFDAQGELLEAHATDDDGDPVSDFNSLANFSREYQHRRFPLKDLLRLLCSTLNPRRDYCCPDPSSDFVSPFDVSDP